jgi:hypothetical protein
MKVLKNNIAKQEDDLNTIIHSLFCATLEQKKTSIVVEKKYLIFKIVDFCKVSPSKASEYLGILHSRGKLEMSGEDIIYTLQQQKSQDNIMDLNKI